MQVGLRFGLGKDLDVTAAFDARSQLLNDLPNNPLYSEKRYNLGGRFGILYLL